MEFEAEIICLGNELLIGRTVNTNANYLAKKLTQNGFKVTRVTTVRDDLEEASRVIKEMMSREPKVCCISGGLGPTHDDIQLKVVAHAISRGLEFNEQAMDMIRPKYEKMNESRKKMAYLPKGGKPLPNSEGSAPGVFLKSEDTFLLCLPGVPTEMKAIMSEEALPLLLKEVDFKERLYEYGIDIRGARESDITEITNNIRSEYKNINFKSHPKKDDKGYYLSLHTYVISDDATEVKQALIDWKNAIADTFNIAEETKIERILED